MCWKCSQRHFLTSLYINHHNESILCARSVYTVYKSKDIQTRARCISSSNIVEEAVAAFAIENKIFLNSHHKILPCGSRRTCCVVCRGAKKVYRCVCDYTTFLEICSLGCKVSACVEIFSKLSTLLFNIKQWSVLGVFNSFNWNSPSAAGGRKISTNLFEYFTVRKYSPVGNNWDMHQWLHRHRKIMLKTLLMINLYCIWL